jgi:hypothetical protein
MQPYMYSEVYDKRAVSQLTSMYSYDDIFSYCVEANEGVNSLLSQYVVSILVQYIYTSKREYTLWFWSRMYSQTSIM